MSKRLLLALFALTLSPAVSSAGPVRNAAQRWREARPLRTVVAGTLRLPGSGYGPTDPPPAIYGGPGTRRVTAPPAGSTSATVLPPNAGGTPSVDASDYWAPVPGGYQHFRFGRPGAVVRGACAGGVCPR